MNHELPDVQAGFEQAEESEIKFPTSAGSLEKQENSRKITASLTLLKPLAVWITTNWKILKKMGIPDQFTCLLRNLYAGQKATVRTGHGTRLVQNWKKERQGCVLPPWLLTYMQSTSWEMLGWMKHKLESKIAGRNINNIWYAGDTTLKAESEEALVPLDEGKRMKLS